MGNICFHIVGKFDRLGFLFCYAGDTMIYLGLVLGLYHGAIPGTGVGVENNDGTFNAIYWTSPKLDRRWRSLSTTDGDSVT
jgi:hypothetical protein